MFSKTELAISEDLLVLNLSIISWVFITCSLREFLSFNKALTVLKIFFGLHYDCNSSGIISLFAAILIMLANFTFTSDFTIKKFKLFIL